MLPSLSQRPWQKKYVPCFQENVIICTFSCVQVLCSSLAGKEAARGGSKGAWNVCLDSKYSLTHTIQSKHCRVYSFGWVQVNTHTGLTPLSYTTTSTKSILSLAYKSSPNCNYLYKTSNRIVHNINVQWVIFRCHSNSWHLVQWQTVIHLVRCVVISQMTFFFYHTIEIPCFLALFHCE